MDCSHVNNMFIFDITSEKSSKKMKIQRPFEKSNDMIKILSPKRFQITKNLHSLIFFIFIQPQINLQDLLAFLALYSLECFSCACHSQLDNAINMENGNLIATGCEGLRYTNLEGYRRSNTFLGANYGFDKTLEAR